MKLKPLGDRVLVKRLAQEETTKGGIIIPDTAKEKTMEGQVIAIGDDKDVIKVSVKDRILFDKYAGTEVSVDGEDHLLMRADDILAVIE